jgi:hypothetical protein
MITVITPTIREKGLVLVEKALKRQTEPFEWIIVSPFTPQVTVPHVWIPEPPKQKGDYWSIYTAYNLAVSRARGDLLISWQDFTYTKPDTLERFATHYKLDPKAIVTAVGHKYSDDTFREITWKDPRIKDGTLKPCAYNEIELNMCSFPKEAIVSVGGFDQWLNKYSSVCGLDVLDRLNIQGGWNFKLDGGIETYSLEHGRLPDWEEHNPLRGIYQEHRKEYLLNPVLNYLDLITTPNST